MKIAIISDQIYFVSKCYHLKDFVLLNKLIKIYSLE